MSITYVKVSLLLITINARSFFFLINTFCFLGCKYLDEASEARFSLYFTTDIDNFLNLRFNLTHLILLKI